MGAKAGASATGGGFRATTPASAGASLQDAAARGNAYANTAATATSAEVERRMAELDAKEAQLKQKEAELQRALAQIKGLRPNNWPPCAPIMHHDIKGEIPAEGVGTVRRLYMLWYFTCLCYLWNFCTQIGALATGSGSGLGFFLSIAYVLLAPPITLICWYKQAYEGYRAGKSTKFVLFFLNLFIQTLASIVFLIGFETTGGIGVITCINFSKSNSKGLVIMAVTMIFMWLILLISSIAMLKSVHAFYRGRGGDFQRDARLLAREGAVSAATATV